MRSPRSRSPPRTSLPSTRVSQQTRVPNYWAIFYIGKREVYNFLAVDVGVYLPAYEQCTIYFLKDLARGKKKSKYDRHDTLTALVI